MNDPRAAMGGMVRWVLAAVTFAVFAAVSPAGAKTPENAPFSARFEDAVKAVLPQMIAWRRDLHQHPELGNQEFRTSRMIAGQLRRLALDDVRTGVARTGVVGVLHGGRAGPIVAVRADMDGLPVTEETGLRFASKARVTFGGQEVGIMHACGHDAHMAIQLALAQVLAGRRSDLAGTVIFVFQPDEEGAADMETTGARMMVQENVFGELKPEAIFALHVLPEEGGALFGAAGPTMASEDNFRITVHGRQAHGAMPHRGIDSIVLAAQTVTALQMIASRQVDAVSTPAVITVGAINGGVRSNIIPDQVVLQGTVRTLTPGLADDVKQRIRRTVDGIAASAGTTAAIQFSHYAPVLVNDQATTRRATSAIEGALATSVRPIRPLMTAEDFSFFTREVPGFYFYLGVNAPGAIDAAPNHSPRFHVHEPSLETGLRAMLAVVLDRVSKNHLDGGGGNERASSRSHFLNWENAVLVSISGGQAR